MTARLLAIFSLPLLAPSAFAAAPPRPLAPKPGAVVLALLRGSAGGLGQSMVMVTHDAQAATIADRVLFLAYGSMVEELPRSPASEILAAMARTSA